MFLELTAIKPVLEGEFKDMQDFEFSVDEGQLFLQSRPGQRTPWAALRVRPFDGDRPLARGIPAGLGVATGAIVFDVQRALQLAPDRPVVLARTELATDDIAGLSAAAGLLTTLGGRTSHAAVVARQLGKPCLVGCTALSLDQTRHTCRIGSQTLSEGDIVTIDAEGGCVYQGPVAVVTERPEEALQKVERWRRFSGKSCVSS